MTPAYYNENDPFAAAWLRELIAAGRIAPGDVDDRSIIDVVPDDLVGYRQCHFFAGIGGWSLALRLAGWPDERPVWTGSCPCQPFSSAGRRDGFRDSRHLWPWFGGLVAQRRPVAVFGEQVGGRGGREWLDPVFADLEANGYACGAVDFPAASVGAPHIRQRLYWCGLAHAGEHGFQGRILRRQDAERRTLDRPAGRDGATGGLVHAHGDGRGAGQRNRPPLGHRHTAGAAGGNGRPGATNGHWRDADWLLCRDGKWRAVEPGAFPLAHGVSARVGRLRGYGNAIVPQQAAAFIRAAMEAI